ncbi:MAG: Omp28-related outer membrane protein [bacterium]
MKKFLLGFLVIAFVSNYMYAQTLVSTDPLPRNVVLEEFTGIHCGFCPYGHQIGQALRDNNPCRVVLINIHSGGYAVPAAGTDEPDFRTPYGEAIDDMAGLKGYPAGQVNRQIFHGAKYSQQDSIANTLALHRSGWETAANEILNDAYSPVNIGAAVTRIGVDSLQITVELYYTANAGQTHKLNVVLLESGFIGYQGGSLGGENYVHNHIMRDMITGQWGEVISTTAQGTFITKTYNYKITDRVESIGSDFQLAFFVTNDDNKTIHTGIEISVPIIYPTAILSSTSSDFDVKPQGESFSKDFILKNISNQEITFNLSVEKTSRTPDDWTVGIVQPATNTVSVLPGDSTTIIAQITPGSTLGFGDAILTALETNTEIIKSYKSTLTCLSQEIENFEIINESESKYSISSQLQSAGLQDIFSLTFNDYRTYREKFVNKSHVVWNTGTFDVFSQADVDAILADINDGKKLFICGHLCGSYLNNYGGLGLFGVEAIGYSLIGLGQAPNRVWLSGVGGDPISQDFGVKTEGNLIQYLVNLLKITDVENVRPILHFTNDGKKVQTINSVRDTSDIKGKDAIFAVRVRHENTRSVLMGLNPYVIVNAASRQNLITNIMKWLDNTGPELDLNQGTLDYEYVLINEEKTLPVVMFNPSEEDLTISDISIDGMDAYAFEIDNSNPLPLTISTGKYKNFLVKFKPIATQNYKASLNITSNATMNPDITLDIVGSAGTTEIPEISYKNDMFRIYPNPTSGETRLVLNSYQLQNNDIKISVFGITGNKLQDISVSFNKSSELLIDLTDLANGTYYIKAEINGKQYIEPLVIIK